MHNMIQQYHPRKVGGFNMIQSTNMESQVGIQWYMTQVVEINAEAG